MITLYSAPALQQSIIKEKSRRRTQNLTGFKRITREAMREIWPYLQTETGRTTDFSYGGMLMWVDYFNYEYALANGTLFIRGVVESDRSTPAFSLPVGRLPLSHSIAMLKDYCESIGENLELSAVPGYAIPELERLGAKKVEELTDWGDYLYNATDLAYLKGKRYGKKRNHVNQFLSLYPDWRLESMTPANAKVAMDFMDVFDLEGDDNESAIAERKLTRDMISEIDLGDSMLKGAILYVGDKVAGFTIGDIKGDTLFIHIEKCTREVAGSYEMINKAFAEKMLEENPELKFINREDCAGDEGLRRAKDSYHPVEILKKYNVIF